MRILRSIRPRVAAAVAAAVLALPLAVLATNTTWTADTELQVGAHRLIILSGSESDSLSVDSSASTFTVTVSNTDTFTVRYPSPNAGTLNNDGGLSACNNVGGNNDVAVTAPSGGSVTVTFTPSSTACVAGGGGSTTPTIILSQPNGGQTFTGGTTTQVFWGTGGSGIQSVRLSLSLDSGATFSLIADNEANDGTYDWSVPSTSTTTARMKVEALGTGAAILASDTSDANFSITVPSSGGGGGGGGTITPPPPPPPPPADAKVLPKITAFSPASGPVGTVVTISGTDLGSDVTVNFGGVAAPDIILVTSTSVKVTVPAGAATGTIELRNSVGTATSGGTFTVTPGTAPEGSALRVKVLSPNGGESYPTSAAMMMRWILRYSASSSNSIVSTTPYLTVDGGATWNAIGDALVRPDGTYTFQLTVPVTLSARVRVVAVDQFGNMASDDSDADFTVATAGSTPIVPTYPSGTFDAVPLTDEEIKAPDDDPNASGGSYSAGGATAATPTIDVDKNLIPPPPEVKLPCIGGSLIKVRTNSAVYYCGKNGRRFVFPNEKIYFTWFANFNAVAVISDATMSTIPIGGNITYKPGVKMVKLQTDPKVYAIARDGLLRWVKDEAVAVRLYGPTWNQKIDDVPDSFFFNYKIGDPLE